MPMTPLPTLDRTSATFKTDVDDFFATDLPLFVTEANTLETNVVNKEASAVSSASTATTKASEAAASASAASSSASAASTSASNASTSESNALTYANNAAASYDAFDDRYLGSKSSDPALDNDGNALLTGALYFNSVSSEMRVWTGSVWEVAYVGAGSYLISSDIGSTVQAYDADLDTWSGKTAPTGTVVGDTDTQTLTNKTTSGLVINDGYTEEVYAIPSSTTPALSPTNGSIQTWTLTGNSTPTSGTWAAGQSITLMIDDGTAYTVTWTSLAVTWKTDTGSAPTLNTSGYTAIALWKVGSTIYGARVGDA